MPHISELGFTPTQLDILQQIHSLSRQLEHIKNTGRVHAVIAILSELSADYIALPYLLEKLSLLFPDYKFSAEPWEESEK